MSRLLHNQLESAVGTVVSSVIGGNGTAGGSPIFEAEKFGNGVFLTTSQYVAFDDASYWHLTRGAIDFWIKPHAGQSWNLGHPSMSSVFLSGSTVDYQERLQWVSYTDNGVNCGFYHLGMWSAFPLWMDVPIFNLATGVQGHIAFAWDVNGINGPGTNTVELYFNGALAASSTNPLAVPTTFTVPVRLGAWAWSASLEPESAIDNLRVWDTPYQDWTTRKEVEGDSSHVPVLIEKTIGATGDYATWASFLASVPTPPIDNYLITVQAGTYNEEMLWDKNSLGLSIVVKAADGATPIFHGQSVRNHCLHTTSGGLTVYGIQFRGAVAESILLEGNDASAFYGGSIYNGTKGISDYVNAKTFTVQGMYFENQATVCVETYSDGAAKKRIAGCTAHWTVAGGTPDFAFEMDGGGYVATGSVIEGCRVYTDDVTKGPTGAIFGANFLVKRTRSFNPRGYHYRDSWGTASRLENCLAKKTGGASYDGVYYTGGANYIVYRCLFLGVGASFTGVQVSGASTVTVKNCGFVGLTANSGMDVAVGGTIVNTYNGYYNCLAKVTGAGTYNPSPETGEVATDPGLLSTSMDGELVLETSTWVNVGNADGLPVVQTNPDLGCEEIMPAKLMTD